MKKTKLLRMFAIAALTALAATSCNKAPAPVNNNDASKPQEVTFSSAQMTKGSNKDGLINAKDALANADANKANYADIVINGTTYTPSVYYLNSIAYTQAIKLAPGTYTISKFMLMDDNGTPNDNSDDNIVSAAPEAGSPYAAFVSHPLDYTFNVTAFEKSEIPIEVLKFTAQEYTDFGFDWFTMTQTTVREQLFFGDISVKHPSDYAGSLYAQQTNGLQVDMPAIFKIKVYRNGVFLISYNNEANFGEGEPLHVAYPDAENTTDHFRFDLYIYVKNGTNFVYKLFHSWEFTDAQKIDAGTDGIVDFVLGNSNYANPDLLLPPYQNLPATITYKIIGSYAPGSLGGYVDAEIGSVGSGFDFSNGTFSSWCSDHNYTINANHTYNMDVYSSLYPDQMPAFTAYADKWARVNWLFNHLDNYPGHTWGEVQGAIWIIMDSWNGVAHGGVPAADAMTQQMANDSQSHTDFTPLPGGWAAVVFVPEGTDPNQGTPDIQTMFIQVDP